MLNSFWWNFVQSQALSSLYLRVLQYQLNQQQQQQQSSPSTSTTIIDPNLPSSSSSSVVNHQPIATAFLNDFITTTNSNNDDNHPTKDRFKHPYANLSAFKNHDQSINVEQQQLDRKIDLNLEKYWPSILNSETNNHHNGQNIEQDSLKNSSSSNPNPNHQTILKINSQSSNIQSFYAF